MRLRLSMLAAVIAAGALVFGCGGGGGGGGGGGSAGIGPRGAGTLANVGATAFVMNTYGGKGNTGSGGDGGDVWADTYGTGGCIVGTKGTIDTRFIYPADPDGDLGSNGLEVTTNLTINVYIDEADAALVVPVDGYYMRLGSTKIWQVVAGAANDDEVTGLLVNAGRTLTLGLNWSSGGNTGQDMAYVTFSDDVKIAGTVKTKDLTTGTVNGLTADVRHGDGTACARDKGGLDLEANKMLITSTGRINLAGGNATAANTRGGDGGYLYLWADEVIAIHGAIDCKGGNGAGTGVGGDGGQSSGWGIYADLETDGTFINTATINVSGGTGSTGGDAGEFDIYSYSFGNVYNTGMLMSNGGTGTTGDGGEAYGFFVYAYYGSIFNSGKLQSNGGSSTDGDGNYGGEIEFYAGYAYDTNPGGVVNSGMIEAKGGNSTNGNGGDGYYVYAETYGGDFVSNATIDLRGGNGRNAAGYSGGDGGYFEVYTYEGYDDNFLGDYVAAGDIIIGGNIYLQGGTGDDGGDAGYIDFYAGYEDSYYLPGSAGVYAYGYRLIDSRGGAGADGGDGGYINWVTYVGYDEDLDEDTVAGPVIVQCDFNTSGGNGTDGYGGDAEDVWLMSDYAYWSYGGGGVWDENSIVDFRGNILANGGNGTDGGGYNVDSDEIWFWGPSGVTVTGNVSSNGGNATAAGGYGGDCDYGMYIWSEGDITVTGNVSVAGGTGMGDGSGGYAGYVIMEGGYDDETLLTVKGNINAAGGNGGSDGDGGSGGYVRASYFGFMWYYMGSISITGNISTNGGNGAGTADGGYAGYMELYPQYDLALTGNLTARGGNATGTGDGGDGYLITVDTDEGSIEIVGTLDASGGSGDQLGGNGGNDGWTPGIYLISWYGDVVSVVGNIINRGGNAKDDGQGGYAGPVQLYAPKNAIVLGSIDASGGDVIGPDSSGVGGDGSGAFFGPPGVDIYSNLGSMVSGTVNVDGGTALLEANYGDDGYFYLDGVQYLP